jgi:hypothetical protein
MCADPGKFTRKPYRAYDCGTRSLVGKYLIIRCDDEAVVCLGCCLVQEILNNQLYFSYIRYLTIIG